MAQHLSDDGLPPSALDAGGIPGPEPPLCAVARDELLREAPSVSVVICTRDRPDSVRTTVRSILACRYPPERLEVIVVDNASKTDAVVARSARTTSRATSRSASCRNPSPASRTPATRGSGRRPGRSSSSPTTTSRSIATGWRCWSARSREASAWAPPPGTTLPGALETPAQRWVEGFGGRVRGFDTRVFDLLDPPADQPLFPFTVGDLGAGRNMAFRRDVLIEQGGFDPALGPGTLAHDGDDIEALLRVLLSKRQVVHEPAAIVWHAHPRDYRELEQRVWGYGIGLTACLTKAIITHPALLGDLLRKLPRGLAFALSPVSAKNVGRQADFPKALVRLELRGMAYGPIAYARSRVDQRRRRRRSAAPPIRDERAPRPPRFES